MTPRLLRLLTCAAALAGAFPALASGDGLPIGNVDAGLRGIEVAGGAARYVTLNTGRDTVLARVDRGGEVVAYSVFPGTWTLPAVALDGTPDGLAQNTLVLLRPRLTFPQRTTRFMVAKVPNVRVRRRITLRGDFSFDAISPDAATAYLVHYTSRRDPTRYEVRALDLASGRLRPGTIVDKREPDERMRGYPVTRLRSADGRWAYTFYDGSGGEHPFVHALDTVEGVAACIDLDHLAGRTDLMRLRLALTADGGTLSVRDGAGAVAHVDTATWDVSRPAAFVSLGWIMARLA